MTNSTDAGYGNVAIAVTSVSTSGFTARIHNNNDGTLAPYFTWMSVGEMA